jgi:NADPH2 dehydrogenase
MLQVLEAVVETIGPDRTGIKLSPFANLHLEDIDPFETWGYIVQEIRKRFPKLAYVSFIEPQAAMDKASEYSND